jgi:RNA polymerase sigma-70 factor, ECF subfamily
MDTRTQIFERHRPRLFGLAYRMLGSRADAEDALQDAYVRWHKSESSDLRSPEAWLVTIVTRLCLDRLRAAHIEREAYIGPWLPEPLIGAAPPSADAPTELASDLSMAFMLVMERLASDERAAFLLHDVFDTNYLEIARILAKSEAACRQLVSRARKHVREARPRPPVPQAKVRAMLERFVQAVGSQDRGALLALFADDARWTADGGGKRRAARKIIHGREQVAQFVLGVLGRRSDRYSFESTSINGEPGLLLISQGEIFAAMSVCTDGERILDVFSILNPDKLAHAKAI